MSPASRSGHHNNPLCQGGVFLKEVRLGLKSRLLYHHEPPSTFILCQPLHQRAHLLLPSMFCYISDLWICLVPRKILDHACKISRGEISTSLTAFRYHVTFVSDVQKVDSTVLSPCAYQIMGLGTPKPVTLSNYPSFPLLGQ